MNTLRPSIERPGKSAVERHLTRRYAALLDLHDRCRTAASATRLPGIALALNTVRARMAALNTERKAA